MCASSSDYLLPGYFKIPDTNRCDLIFWSSSYLWHVVHICKNAQHYHFTICLSWGLPNPSGRTISSSHLLANHHRCFITWITFIELARLLFPTSGSLNRWASALILKSYWDQVMAWYDFASVDQLSPTPLAGSHFRLASYHSNRLNNKHDIFWIKIIEAPSIRWFFLNRMCSLHGLR